MYAISITVKATQKEVVSALGDDWSDYFEDEDIIEYPEHVALICHDPGRFYWAHRVAEDLKAIFGSGAIIHGELY